tara:strand:- start:360 stop:593 length:234 start_codon:yes stop_codon:yes gene_type:complete
MEKKYIVKESFKRKVRELDFTSLQKLFFHLIEAKELPREQKAPLLNYIEGRLKRLLKKEDYNNPNMTDSEYVAKWGE